MSFRKIDVDAYDEDVLQETELYDPDPRDPAQVLSDAKQKQLVVRSALNRCVSLSVTHVRPTGVADQTPLSVSVGVQGRHLRRAQRRARQSAVRAQRRGSQGARRPLSHLPSPYPNPNPNPDSDPDSPRLPQNLTLQTVVSVLNSTKATDVPTVLRSLSQDDQETLMKYIYKGMGLPGWGDVSGSVLLGWHEKVRFSVRWALYC